MLTIFEGTGKLLLDRRRSSLYISTKEGTLFDRMEQGNVSVANTKSELTGNQQVWVLVTSFHQT